LFFLVVVAAAGDAGSSVAMLEHGATATQVARLTAGWWCCSGRWSKHITVLLLLLLFQVTVSVQQHVS
jgi:hypothetical protein